MLTSGTITKDGLFNELLTENEFTLADGQYYVQEINTNENYVLDDTKYYFSYGKKNNNAIIWINNGVPIVNKLKIVNEDKKVHPNTCPEILGACL